MEWGTPAGVEGCWAMLARDYIVMLGLVEFCRTRPAVFDRYSTRMVFVEGLPPDEVVHGLDK